MSEGNPALNLFPGGEEIEPTHDGVRAEDDDLEYKDPYLYHMRSEPRRTSARSRSMRRRGDGIVCE